MVLVTVDKVNRTGDTATVTTKDSTRLHLRGAGIGLEDYATDVAPRSYTFRLVGGRWQVQGVKDLQELTPSSVVTPVPRLPTSSPRCRASRARAPSPG